MIKLRERIKERASSDRGNAVLLWTLAIFVLMAIMSCFIIDFSQMRGLSRTYNDIAQRATQTSLKEQNSIGGLTPMAAQKVVDEYLTQRNGTDGSTMGYQITRRVANCEAKYPDLPEITVEFSTERDNRGGGFDSKFVYRNGEWQGANPNTGSYPQFFQNQYRTVKVNVKDFGGNFFMGLIGRPCSVHEIQTSAISIDADAGSTGK